MCEPTVSSNAEVGHADVAPERGAVEIPSSNVAAAEYWQTALQEFCKNSPPAQQHAYVANPLAPPPQAYGLWSGQISPPLLTPYGPMPFFGGFFPSAYPIPTPPAAMPQVSIPAIKPEASEEGNTREISGEHQQARKRNKPSVASHPAAASTPPLLVPQRPHAPTLIDHNPTEDEILVRLEDDVGASAVCDDREMKKERRKQSNRESARRSRLRKQRECEALQKQVQDMTEWSQKLERENQQLKQRNAELVRENEQLKNKCYTA